MIKLSVLKENVRSLYEEIYYLIPDDVEGTIKSEEEIEGRTDLAIALGKATSYEVADELFEKGIEEYEKSHPDLSSEIQIWSKWEDTIFYGLQLIIGYGLDEDEFIDWIEKFNPEFKDLLYALVGRELDENAKKQLTDYFDKSSSSNISSSINLSTRNDITISELETENNELQFEVFDKYLTFGPIFDQYDSFISEYNGAFWDGESDMEETIEEILSKTGIGTPGGIIDGLSKIVELYINTAEEISGNLTKTLRENKCEAKGVASFKEGFRNQIVESQTYIGEVTSMIIIGYANSYPGDRKRDHEYLEMIHNYEYLRRLYNLPSLDSGITASAIRTAHNFITDFAVDATNAIADAVSNGLDKLMFETKIAKFLRGDEFKNLFTECLETIRNNLEEDFFNAAGIKNLKLSEKEAPIEDLNLWLDGYLGLRNLQLSEKDRKNYLLSKILDFPYDEKVYALCHLLYGDESGEIKEIINYLYGEDEDTADFFDDCEKELIDTIEDGLLNFEINKKEDLVFLNSKIQHLYQVQPTRFETVYNKIKEKEIQEYYMELPVGTYVELKDTIEQITDFCQGYNKSQEMEQHLKELNVILKTYDYLNEIEETIPEIKRKINECIINVNDDELWREAENGNGYAQFMVEKIEKRKIIDYMASHNIDVNTFEKNFPKINPCLCEKRVQGEPFAIYLYMKILKILAETDRDHSLKDLAEKTILSIADMEIGAAENEAATIYIGRKDVSKAMPYLVRAENQKYPMAFYTHGILLHNEEDTGYNLLAEKMLNIAGLFGIKK